MVKLLRSGKSFSSALCRIQEITQKGSYNPEEYNEIQMLKWLVLEYEEKYCCYDTVENEEETFLVQPEYKIAY